MHYEIAEVVDSEYDVVAKVPRMRWRASENNLSDEPVSIFCG